jgi:hypothetical protein
VHINGRATANLEIINNTNAKIAGYFCSGRDELVASLLSSDPLQKFHWELESQSLVEAILALSGITLFSIHRKHTVY